MPYMSTTATSHSHQHRLSGRGRPSGREVRVEERRRGVRTAGRDGEDDQVALWGGGRDRGDGRDDRQADEDPHEGGRGAGGGRTARPADRRRRGSAAAPRSPPRRGPAWPRPARSTWVPLSPSHPNRGASGTASPRILTAASEMCQQQNVTLTTRVDRGGDPPQTGAVRARRVVTCGRNARSLRNVLGASPLPWRRRSQLGRPVRKAQHVPRVQRRAARAARERARAPSPGSARPRSSAPSPTARVTLPSWRPRSAGSGGRH